MSLQADFYARPVLEVARDLIGCVVEHRGVSGRIVETEAYHESEPACHAFVGITPRTRTLFGEPGIAYVYRSYGIHALLNAVCEPPGVGAAVLIRALEPLDGIEQMRLRRARTGGRLPVRDRDLCSGPGKLTQALGVELSENGTSLVGGPIVIRLGEGIGLQERDGGEERCDPGEGEGLAERKGGEGSRRCEGMGRGQRVGSGQGDGSGQPTVIAGTRIGISKAVELPWRFCARNNPHVSRPWPKMARG